MGKGEPMACLSVGDLASMLKDVDLGRSFRELGHGLDLNKLFFYDLIKSQILRI